MAHVITPISIDHQRFLGDHLATIADAKAGILRLRAGGDWPQPPAAARVIAAEAAKLGAPLFRHGAEWAVAAASSTVIRGGFQFTWRDQTYDLPAPALAGGHQYLNAGAALAAAHVVNALPADHRPRFDLRPAAVAEALATVRWPGRLQKLSHGPLTAGLPAGAKSGSMVAITPAARRCWPRRLRMAAATPERPVVLVMAARTAIAQKILALTGPNLAVGRSPFGQENALEAAEIAASPPPASPPGHHGRVNGRAQPRGHPSAGTGFDLRLALSGRPCAGRKQLSAGMKKRRPKGQRFKDRA